MRLEEVLQGVEVLELRGDPGLDIRGVTYDSRQVQPGFCMVAYPGFVLDGHAFLNEARARGAVAAVVERLEAVPEGLTAVRVAKGRAALAITAANFYGHPSHRLDVVAVTGTNGKTTTTYMIHTILQTLAPTGLIGTVQTMVGGRTGETKRTTPEASDLQQLLAAMLAAGDRRVVMEAASQALILHRMDQTAVDVAVFTNLTQDHLGDPKTGAHRDMEDYFAAKLLLFQRQAAERSKSGKRGPFAAVVNVDDPYGRRLVQLATAPVLRYAIDTEAEVRASRLELNAGGARFLVHYPGGSQEVHLSLPGRFNVQNALAAFAVGYLFEVPAAQIAAALSRVRVPGRFEPVRAGQPFTVVVDYAHTPDGLENVLKAAREIASGRVIAVFGAGGDRDRGKRPQMGAIASRLAEVVVLTSDNPRSEEPEAILAEIARGCVGARELHQEVDRSRAIALAVRLAQPGDIVVIAGKGHETYQIFRDGTIDFDDRLVAREALAAAGYRGQAT